MTEEPKSSSVSRAESLDRRLEARPTERRVQFKESSTEASSPAGLSSRVRAGQPAAIAAVTCQWRCPSKKKEQPRHRGPRPRKRKPTGRGRSPLRMPHGLGSHPSSAPHGGRDGGCRPWRSSDGWPGWNEAGLRPPRQRARPRHQSRPHFGTSPGIETVAIPRRDWAAAADDEQWDRVIRRLGRQAFYAAKLLAGDMPQNIEDIFNAADIALIPRRRRVHHVLHVSRPGCAVQTHSGRSLRSGPGV